MKIVSKFVANVTFDKTYITCSLLFPIHAILYLLRTSMIANVATEAITRLSL